MSYSDYQNTDFNDLMRAMAISFLSGEKPDGSAFDPNSGTPVAGALAADTNAAPLSATSVPCKGVYVFIAAGDQDTLIGDANSQPVSVPAIGMFLKVDDVAKLYGKLSANSANIPWLAIT